MGIRIARLFAEIGADNSGLNKGLTDAEKSIKAFGAADLLKAGLIYSGLRTLTQGFIDAGKQALGAYADFELAGMSMQTLVAKELTMTGAAQSMGQALSMAGGQARDLQEWIQKLAIVSPFTQTGIRSAFQTALAYGMTTKEAQRLSKAVVDFAAGSGRGEASMNQIALALGQIQAKGKLAGQEVLQLVNAGIGVDDILARAFGKSTEQIVEMREKGLIPANLAVQAIVESLEKDFGGAAARAGSSFSGLLSSMQDLKEVGLREFFGATFREIQPMLEDFVSQLQDPQTLEKIRKAGEDLATVFKDVVTTAGNLKTAWDNVDESNKNLLTGLGLTALIGPKLVKGFLAAKGAIAGLSKALGAGAVAAGIWTVAIGSALVAVWQYNQQVVKTNRLGKEMVESGWGQFFDDQVKGGKSAAEILDEYRAAQERVRQQTKVNVKDLTTWNLLSGKVGVEDWAKLFVKDKGGLAGNLEGLNKALAMSSTSFKEYVRLATGAGVKTTFFTQAQWEAIRAQVEAQKMLFGTEQGTKAYSDRMQGLAASLGMVGDVSGTSAAQMFAMQETASGYLGSLDGLIQKQGELKSAMDSWNEGAANDFASILDQKLKPGTERWLQGMGAVDEVFGTAKVRQWEMRQEMDQAAQRFADTGEQDAFIAKMKEIQEEALEGTKKDLEDVTLAAQDLYDKLMGLPEEIRVKIGFDVENYPADFLTAYSKGKQKGFQNYQLDNTTPEMRATGGPVWAGRLYRWLERGPEDFLIPQRNGRVEPAGNADGRPIQVNVAATVKNDIDIYRMSRVIANEIRRANL